MNTMILGGYGQVGSLVTSKLLERKYSDTIIIAGRNVEKAKNLKEKLSCKHKNLTTTRIECREADVTKDMRSILKDIDTVVMCLEQNNEELLIQCIETKTNYIDITPSTQIINQLYKHKKECEDARIRVILGVGIAPGFSNLLAVQASRELDQVTAVESFLMLGVGENHGKNAIGWLVNNLNHKYITDEDMGEKEVKSFRGRKKQILQNGKAHDFTRIDLADSLINRQLFPGAKCNSWFAYDVNIFTRLVCLMQRCGLFTLLRFENMKKLYRYHFGLSMKISKRLHIGTDHYEVIVKVMGVQNGRKTTVTKSISGSCNNDITANIAVKAIEEINECVGGILYLAECVDMDV